MMLSEPRIRRRTRRALSLREWVPSIGQIRIATARCPGTSGSRRRTGGEPSTSRPFVWPATAEASPTRGRLFIEMARGHHPPGATGWLRADCWLERMARRSAYSRTSVARSPVLRVARDRTRARPLRTSRGEQCGRRRGTPENQAKRYQPNDAVLAFLDKPLAATRPHCAALTRRKRCTATPSDRTRHGPLLGTMPPSARSTKDTAPGATAHPTNSDRAGPWRSDRAQGADSATTSARPPEHTRTGGWRHDAAPDRLTGAWGAGPR
jgi:hypothetical protein